MLRVLGNISCNLDTKAMVKGTKAGISVVYHRLQSFFKYLRNTYYVKQFDSMFRTNILLGLIWVESICKGNQKTTKVVTRSNWIRISNMES